MSQHDPNIDRLLTENPVVTRWDWPFVPGAKLRGTRHGAAVDLDCDVVIVGSGAGGATVAAELAEGGLDVIVLEEGGNHTTDQFTTEAARMARVLYRDGGLSIALGDPPVFFSEGKTLGGSTVINGGMTWRTPERVLSVWEKEHGIPGATAEAMEPFFERVEHFISAHVQDPETKSPDNELLKEGAEQRNWKVVENIRNQMHCAGTNNCAFGCPTGAKRSALVSYLPRARRFGARVFADCRVDRVLTRRRPGGHVATGVEGIVLAENDRPMHRFRVRAKTVVVAGGAIQTPTLLLRSKIRSPSKRLGHNLALHPNIKLSAIFDRDIFGWQGVHQQYQVREFFDEGFVMAAVNMPPAITAMSLPLYGQALGELMQDYNKMATCGVLVEDTVRGRVRLGPTGRPLATYQMCETDRKRFLRGASLLSQLFFAAGAKKVFVPFEHKPFLESMDEAIALEEAPITLRSMEVATVHVMGTTAMGADPKRHVCDPWGAVYGTEGLVVADASLFPSPVAVNPMESVMALATRNAQRLLDMR